jgi:hypothetical protein
MVPVGAAVYINDKLITVQATPGPGGWVCEVAVDESGQRTAHTVTVSRASLARWGRGSDEGAVQDLVRRSFEFLLEREPPGSILRRFDLTAIERHFPEYDTLFRSTPG